MAITTYTLEQVAAHSGPETGLGLASDGKVYDVSEFITSHPGGEKPFLNIEGKDASAAFHSIGKHASNEGIPAPDGEALHW